MEAKIFEVLDRATFMPMVATVLRPTAGGFDTYVLRRTGYNWRAENTVILTQVSTGRTQIEPRDWADRTRATAHNYIIENWDTLISGQVIDVEFVLGESEAPKCSEVYSVPV